MKTLKEINFQQNRKLINLYRKNRDIELQKKIEKIFLETDNTALRIKLIESLDKENQKTTEYPLIKKKEENNNKDKQSSETSYLKAKEPNLIRTKKNFQSKKLLESLWDKVISSLGLNHKIKNFARKSKTIEYSFLKIFLSKETILFFSKIKESKITNILRLFDYFKKEGWSQWEPYTYNYFYNLYLFLYEFFQIKFWLKKNLNLEDYAKRTYKMQYHYSVYLNEQVKFEDIIQKGKKFVLNNKEFMQKQSLLNEIFYFLEQLEKQDIKLTEIIQAFYICSENRMFYWKDILKILKPVPIDKKRFSNEEKLFQKKIHLKILKIKSTIKAIEEENSYMESIKKDYFTYKENQVNIDFIKEITTNYIKNHYYTKNNQTDDLKELHLSNPMYLLEVILEHINSYNFLISSETKLLNPLNKKIIVSKILDIPDFHFIFKKFKSLKKSLESFIKINTNLKYSFNDIENRITRIDGKHLLILDICNEFTENCWELAKNCNIILKNHFQALSKFKKEDSVILYPNKTISKIENKPRFIPYHNHKVLNQNHLKQTTIPDILHFFTKLLYNSIYLYKDSYMIKLFDRKHIMFQNNHLQELYKEYKRLSQKEYEKK